MRLSNRKNHVRDLRVIYDFTGNAKILATTNAI